MKRKSMRKFIRENRQAIDEAIKRKRPNGWPLDDNGRREWIANDVDLYQWARSEGVKV